MSMYLSNVAFLGKQIVTNLFQRTGLEFDCVPFAGANLVGFSVFYKTNLICNVSFMAREGMESFYALTEAEIDDAVDAFLTVDGVAA